MHLWFLKLSWFTFTVVISCSQYHIYTYWQSNKEFTECEGPTLPSHSEFCSQTNTQTFMMLYASWPLWLSGGWGWSTLYPFPYQSELCSMTNKHLWCYRVMIVEGSLLHNHLNCVHRQIHKHLWCYKLMVVEVIYSTFISVSIWIVFTNQKYTFIML